MAKKPKKKENVCPDCGRDMEARYAADAVKAMREIVFEDTFLEVKVVNDAPVYSFTWGEISLTNDCAFCNLAVLTDALKTMKRGKKLVAQAAVQCFCPECQFIMTIVGADDVIVDPYNPAENVEEPGTFTNPFDAENPEEMYMTCLNESCLLYEQRYSLPKITLYKKEEMVPPPVE